MSTNPKNSIAPGSGDNDQPLSSVGGTSKKFKKRNSRSSIGMQDVMGIKSTDDIENFYEVSSRFNALNKEIAMVEYYIESRKTETEKDSEELKSPDYNEDAYRAECEEKKQPRGFPKRKIEGKWCAKEPINIDEARNELKDVEEQIKEIET